MWVLMEQVLIIICGLHNKSQDVLEIHLIYSYCDSALI